MPSISTNLQAIHAKIAAAAKASNRDRASIKLIAVSKTQPLEAVQAALTAGQTVFGENRVQEAKTKFSTLSPPPLGGGLGGGSSPIPEPRIPSPDLSAVASAKAELHLIGPLQTNKVDDAVALFDVIQTLDRPKLAAALARAIKKAGRAPRLYIEVNTGNEPQKAGILPENLPDFLAQCQNEYGLTVTGLMCIPPFDEDPSPHFQNLKRLADAHNLPNISMGMSADYEEAIRCGATEIRIGTAIFGERNTT